MWHRIPIIALFLWGHGIIFSSTLAMVSYEDGLQREELLLKTPGLSENFKKLILDFRKTKIDLGTSFTREELQNMIALAEKYQILSQEEKLKVLMWARDYYIEESGIPQCKISLLISLAYNKEIDYQKEIEYSHQFAIDNECRIRPTVFPFSIKKKGDRSLFISHRPNRIVCFAFAYSRYITEENTGNRNYRDLTKVDYFLEDDSAEVKALFQKIKEDKADVLQVVTKEQFKNALDNARQYQNLKKEEQQDFLELLKKTASH